MSTLSADLFSAALRGRSVQVVHDGGSRPLAVTRWRDLTGSDRVVLAACDGATLDVGCGPGRMTAGLTATGRPALGIDIVAEAVRQTRERGAAALRRDVYDALPGEGRWSTVLLADGNIGIGGDALRLLRRTAELLAPGGRLVVDLAAPGRPSGVHHLWLSGHGRVSERFPWAVVSVDAIGVLAIRAGLGVQGVQACDDRWFAVLERLAP